MNTKKIIYNVTFFVLTFFILSSPAWAATYYVDAINGKDTNTGLSEATAWKTIAKVNASSFKPGDQILFKRGMIWRETLNVPSSGAEGKPVTFGAYGTGNKPIITGANVISGWTLHKQSTFKVMMLSVQPNQVFMESERLTKGTSTDTLNNKEWFWATGVLYLKNDMGNPDTTGKVIEASQRDHCVLVNYPGVKNFIVIDGLLIEKANSIGIFVGSALNGFTVSNSVIQSCYYDALKVTCRIRQSNGLIRGNTMAFNGSSGVDITETADSWVIEGNKSHDNCQINDKNHDFCGGIRVWGNFTNATNMVIQGNEIYRNGTVSPTANRGVGIWLDECGGGNTVRYNSVHHNNSNGIFLEATSYSTVYYNIVWANNGVNAWTFGGIFLTRTASNNTVSNNTLYNNWAGIAVASWGEANKVANNVIINNISLGNVKDLYADRGGDNDGIHGSGNIYQRNCFGAERAGFIKWGGTNYSSYAQWESAYGKPTYSVKSDPQLVNPELGIFKLQSSSPCIDTGTNVGLAHDYEGIGVPQGDGVDIGGLEFVPAHSAMPAPPRNFKIHS